MQSNTGKWLQCILRLIQKENRNQQDNRIGETNLKVEEKKLKNKHIGTMSMRFQPARRVNKNDVSTKYYIVTFHSVKKF